MNQIKQLALITLSVAAMQIKAYSQEGRPKMDEKVRQAIQTCEKENNLTRPEPGQRPTESERKIMEACLAKKGVQMPEPHHGGHHPDEDRSDEGRSNFENSGQQSSDTSTAQ